MSITWKGFKEMTKQYEIPRPKVVEQWWKDLRYNIVFILPEAEARPIEEPGARKLHAGILCGVRRVTGVSTVTMKLSAPNKLV
jgi:hypothetical protein